MNLILKGSICYSKSLRELATLEGGYIVCEGGVSRGVFREVPEKYSTFSVADYGESVIIPGLVDLHLHAPQYSYRGLGMDLELLDWLSTHTFPEESRYAELDYADKAYSAFVDNLKRGSTTRAGVFATIHAPATLLLMEKLEHSGLVTLVGKVNMDRNSPDFLREASAQSAYEATRAWIEQSLGKFRNTAPIISPRFVPTCTGELMRGLGELQKEFGLPVQSHLSENRGEIAWVKELHPRAEFYGEVYDSYGLFGGDGVPTIMAHCVWSHGAEEALLRENGVYIAHCPQSNTNLASGIAPIRRFLEGGQRVGLGTDVAGGCHTSIFRAMTDAIQCSKLRWRLVEQNDAPLTVPEAFYLGTIGGGSFFGKVGSFEDGYEFDAVVIDDSPLAATNPLPLEDRLARIIYLSNDSQIRAKYVRGKKV
ncbi:MAG: amidohydrolase family protein [Oscillospiraceae bacterium]|nr:amidohydrolase family protein [Oscillospiraceae bacterium]